MEHAQRSPSAAQVTAFDTGTALRKITQAMHAVQAPPDVPAQAGAALNANQVLAALTLLRELRTEIAGWEPELIEAARALGTSWADLAPALGVASRQAAERRYLRLRPSPDGGVGTGDQRVAAERDKRAGDKAVAVWARDNAAGLRQLAGQIGALTDLDSGATGLSALHDALGRDDVADLLAPLADTRGLLQPGHPGLAEQVGQLGASIAEVRAASDRSRRPSSS
ncbi:HSP18 transcriptional regulator [Catenulispora pinisilvae]|uniref:HSP18 transcriptional regulator n=1 Tax=Catenulispora pinisilvae TaxID=2705253 RepID=UPI0018925A82|nr:HSP18 transcriptional regulator [Catenulispora pinisilvae]